MSTVDELHTLRKAFYVGAYQFVINEATQGGDALRSERKALLCRAYLAQGRALMARQEASGEAAAELRAVALLAATDRDARAKADDARALLQEGTASPLVALLAASVLYAADAYDEVLAALNPFKKNLENLALFVQTLLKMNRLDLAKAEIATMKTWADDATLAQIIEAWVNLFPSADDKFQEAFYTFDELASSNTATAKLLTSKAVCKIHAQKFDEAEELLGNALNWNNNDTEAIINLIVCAHATGKPAEVAQRYTNQLRDIAPNHIYLQELQMKEDIEFYERALEERWNTSHNPAVVPDGFQVEAKVASSLRVVTIIPMDLETITAVLEFVYSGSVQVSDAILTRVSMFADQPVLHSLKDQCLQHRLDYSLTHKNALEFYVISKRLGFLVGMEAALCETFD
ncbi:hypothetical protein HDU98_002173 [Podochytrium sp. JEL0797]|nr:hypothetical protein HDU98_002173 [Podochytrium sp. JEL0797]